jgi:hypothetical protein
MFGHAFPLVLIAHHTIPQKWYGPCLQSWKKRQYDLELKMWQYLDDVALAHPDREKLRKCAKDLLQYLASYGGQVSTEKSVTNPIWHVPWFNLEFTRTLVRLYSVATRISPTIQ